MGVVNCPFKCTPNRRQAESESVNDHVSNCKFKAEDTPYCQALTTAQPLKTTINGLSLATE